MGKGEPNPVTDLEFLLCCLEAATEINIDFSIVSKATGYRHDASARTRLRNIKTTTRSYVKEYQTLNSKHDGHHEGAGASISEGPETRSKKKKQKEKGKTGDGEKDDIPGGSGGKSKTQKDSHEEEKKVNKSKRSTARSSSGAKDGK
ncbi:hypothetical protein AA313_de0205141 [Arthrobotrys entomopaga]|nr:hypothetical protein AA313_de0205141 [Arthrobotrys entomopaga]